jgi:hypothetical protein
MSASPAFPLDRVVQARQAIKDARTVKRHAWEKEDLALEEDQKKLDTLLLDMLNKNGASSIATEHGTVIRSLKLKPSAADWGAIWAWAVANNGFEIVEKRLKAAFIKEYMDENDGAIPPGINVHREYEVSVRRPTAKPTSGGSPAAQGEE